MRVCGGCMYEKRLLIVHDPAAQLAVCNHLLCFLSRNGERDMMKSRVRIAGRQAGRGRTTEDDREKRDYRNEMLAVFARRPQPHLPMLALAAKVRAGR